VCHAHPDTPIRPRALLYIHQKLWIFRLKWADNSARAQPSQWEGGQPKSPLPTSAKIGRGSARHHYPRPIYDGIFYFEILIWRLILKLYLEMEIVLVNGSARVRPNRWMGGRPGPHAPSEVSVLHATNTVRHAGQKRPACVQDQVGGWGGKRKIYPRPRQVKLCHVTTPLLPTCAAALQKILTKQSKHMYMYLLTKLFASQTATWHVYFKIHHIYKSITQFAKRGTWSRCWRAERAASTWHAARLRLLNAVQKGLFLNSYIQFNTATPKPEWFWRAGGFEGVHMGPRLK
jgi:hypothetical protein